MEYTKRIKEQACEIAIKGRFTFADHKEFRSIFNLLTDKDVKSIRLDFKGVEFIDSAALGILLLARDEAQKHAKDLVIQNPSGQVKLMFEVSRFYDIFNIEG